MMAMATKQELTEEEKKEGWKISRYGVKYKLGEKDIIDGHREVIFKDSMAKYNKKDPPTMATHHESHGRLVRNKKMPTRKEVHADIEGQVKRKEISRKEARIMKKEYDCDVLDC